MALPQADLNKIANVSHLACGIQLSADFNFMGLVNIKHYLNLTKAMNNASCCELVSLIPESINTITNDIDGILKDLTGLGSTFGLLKVPTNLGQLIGWVGGFISVVLGLNVSAFVKKEAQLIALIAEVTTLVSAIEHVLSNLGGCAEAFLPNVNINIPAMHFRLPDGSVLGHDPQSIGFDGGGTPSPSPSPSGGGGGGSGGQPTPTPKPPPDGTG